MRWLIVVIAMILLSTVVFGATQLECFDSDGGNNEFRYGVTNYKGKSMEDKCNGRTLTEYYCGTTENDLGDEVSIILEDSHTCKVTCTRGACWRQTEASSDEDGERQLWECERDKDCGDTECVDNELIRHSCKDHKCVEKRLACGKEFYCREEEGCLRVPGKSDAPQVESAPGFEDKKESDIVKEYLALVKESPKPLVAKPYNPPEPAQVFAYNGNTWVDAALLQYNKAYLKDTGYEGYADNMKTYLDKKKLLIQERIKKKRAGYILDVDSFIEKNKNMSKDEVLLFFGDRYEDEIDIINDLKKDVKEINGELEKVDSDVALFQEKVKDAETAYTAQCTAVESEYTYLQSPSWWQKIWPWSAFKKKTGRWAVQDKIDELHTICSS